MRHAGERACEWCPLFCGSSRRELVVHSFIEISWLVHQLPSHHHFNQFLENGIHKMVIYKNRFDKQIWQVLQHILRKWLVVVIVAAECSSLDASVVTLEFQRRLSFLTSGGSVGVISTICGSKPFIAHWISHGFGLIDDLKEKTSFSNEASFRDCLSFSILTINLLLQWCT